MRQPSVFSSCLKLETESPRLPAGWCHSAPANDTDGVAGHGGGRRYRAEYPVYVIVSGIPALNFMNMGT